MIPNGIHYQDNEDKFQLTCLLDKKTVSQYYSIISPSLRTSFCLSVYPSNQLTGLKTIGKNVRQSEISRLLFLPALAFKQSHDRKEVQYTDGKLDRALQTNREVLINFREP
jgi:hypothetical protein